MFTIQRKNGKYIFTNKRDHRSIYCPNRKITYLNRTFNCPLFPFNFPRTLPFMIDRYKFPVFNITQTANLSLTPEYLKIIGTQLMPDLIHTDLLNFTGLELEPIQYEK